MPSIAEIAINDHLTALFFLGATHKPAIMKVTAAIAPPVEKATNSLNIILTLIVNRALATTEAAKAAGKNNSQRITSSM